MTDPDPCLLTHKRTAQQGGDEHKFKEISAAYEILSDDNKRAQYDKYGLEGVSGDDVGAAGGEGECVHFMIYTYLCK